MFKKMISKVEKFVKEQAATIENKKLEQFVLKNIDKLKAGERDLYL